MGKKIGLVLGTMVLLATSAPGASSLAGNPLGATPVSAATEAKETVVTERVMGLRSGMGMRHRSKIIAKIPKGATVTVEKRTKSYTTVTYNGKTGVVLSKALFGTPQKTINKRTIARNFTERTYELTDDTALRTAKSDTATVLKTMPKGAKVQSSHRVGYWYKVTFDGQTGWAKSDTFKYLYLTMNKPTPPVTEKPVVNDFLSLYRSHKHLTDADSALSPHYKLFREDAKGHYSATLLKSTSPTLSARYKTVFVQFDSKKPSYMMVNTSRYRANPHLKEEGDKAIKVASEAFFGKGTTGAEEIEKFFRANLNPKKQEEKTMKFGGKTADVFIGLYDTTITFR